MWIFIAGFLFAVRSVLLPFVLSILLAYVLNPLIIILSKLSIRKKHLSKPVCVVIVYFFIFLISFMTITLIAPQIYKESSRLLKEASNFANSIDESTINSWSIEIDNFFKKYNLPFDMVLNAPKEMEMEDFAHKTSLLTIDLLKLSTDLINNIIYYSKNEIKSIILNAQIVINKMVSFVFILLLIFMITGFILIDSQKIKDFMFKLIPMQDKELFDEFLINLDIRLSGVIRGQLIICFVNAFLTLIGLLILDINYAFILATMAGIFSIIPVFGSIISTIPIFLVSLASSFLSGVLALIWIGIIHLLEANLLNPKIMGHSAKIHPILIILSLLVGEHFYGIIGALLAVPLVSVIVTIYASVLIKWQESLSSGCKSR